MLSSHHMPGFLLLLLLQMLGVPWLRPLVLVVKALLVNSNLHDAAQCGLSSWNALQMVLAALQSEGLVPEAVLETFATAKAADAAHKDSRGAGGRAYDGERLLTLPQLASFREQQHMAVMGQHREEGSERLGDQEAVDLGKLLVSLLLRYGVVFDYTSDAISVSGGGVVPAPNSWKRELADGTRVMVFDPMRADIWNAARPTNRCREIREVLAVGAAKLLMDIVLKQQLTAGLQLPKEAGASSRSTGSEGPLGAAEGAEAAAEEREGLRQGESSRGGARGMAPPAAAARAV
jgi:hypothetical protein